MEQWERYSTTIVPREGVNVLTLRLVNEEHAERFARTAVLKDVAVRTSSGVILLKPEGVKDGDAFRAMLAAPPVFEEVLKTYKGAMLRFNRNLKIVVSEYNAFFGAYTAKADDMLRFGSSLYVADMLGLFMREEVLSSVYWAFYSWFFQAVDTVKDGHALSGTGELMARMCGSGTEYVKTDVKSPGFNSPAFGIFKPRKDIPVISSHATYDPGAGALNLFVINKSETDPVVTRMSVMGARVSDTVSVTTWKASSFRSMPAYKNAPEGKTEVTEKELMLSDLDAYTLPPTSFTVIRMKVQK
jgi:hypothetical protein